MSGIFSPGQMVTPVNWADVVDLCNLSGGGKAARETDDLKVIGNLRKGDVALVVHVSSGGGDVYVHGPRGSGWAFGAFLEVMLKPTQD